MLTHAGQAFVLPSASQHGRTALQPASVCQRGAECSWGRDRLHHQCKHNSVVFHGRSNGVQAEFKSVIRLNIAVGRGYDVIIPWVIVFSIFLLLQSAHAYKYASVHDEALLQPKNEVCIKIDVGDLCAFVNWAIRLFRFMLFWP